MAKVDWEKATDRIEWYKKLLPGYSLTLTDYTNLLALLRTGKRLEAEGILIRAKFEGIRQRCRDLEAKLAQKDKLLTALATTESTGKERK